MKCTRGSALFPITCQAKKKSTHTGVSQFSMRDSKRVDNERKWSFEPSGEGAADAG